MLKKFSTLLVICSAFLPTLSSAGNYSIGVEGFRDTYHESDLDLEIKSDFGSITANYTTQGRKAFFGLDGRMSYGTNDYESPSGKLSGVPQWEFELRGRFGLTTPLWGGSFSPYTGVGMRYFRDEGKGYYTDTGNVAYDRRIFQAYIPIGASLSYITDDGWHITPQAEADLMFYGNVNSRLTNVGIVNIPGVGPGQYNDPAYNRQTWGLGARGELMFGKSSGNYSWQVGPFIRYWWVPESDVDVYSVTGSSTLVGVLEPENDRTQVGVAARLIW